MGLRETQDWLLGQPAFLSDVNRLHEGSVARQFSKLARVEQIAPFRPDWPRLLLSASLLAQGGSPQAREIALRIAQTAMEDPGCAVAHRDAATVVLDELANRRAIALAEERRLVQPALDERLGVSGLIDWTRRGIEHSIDMPGGEVLHATAFQRAFWREAPEADWLSASAPTSAGKSYIITQWLVELLATGKGNVVYLAPTRALVQQVERDVRALLRERRLAGVTTITIPFNNRRLASEGPKVLIFTQERLHHFLREHGAGIPLDAIVVDEAHKISDRHRGVFASPLADNPETLVDDAPPDARTGVVPSDDVTVSQNLLWLDRVRGRPGEYELTLRQLGRGAVLGEFRIDREATSGQAKLAHLAVACDTGGGTLIYVDDANAAERVAAKLSRLLPIAEPSDDLADLADLARTAVHRSYGLAKTLPHGVAFHYGNMPQIVRSGIEDLFRSGEIRFLVCTATLVEGVNLPCRTLLVRAPKRGERPMDAADFWNLAGRAGRWGKEFQGNIVCVDARDGEVWKEGPPPDRARFRVQRATDRMFAELESLLEFLRSGSNPDATRTTELEAMASYLATTVLRYDGLDQAPWRERLPATDLAEMQIVVANLIDGLEVPRDLVARHPGIGPAAMSRLLQALRTMGRDPESLLPVQPSASDAVKRYADLFDIIRHHLNPAFGVGKSTFGLALTTCEWMRGRPVARIVSSKLDWHKRKKTGRSVASIIRDTLREIEEIARFQAPRLLACYGDVLAVWLSELGRDDLAQRLPALTLALEFGVGGNTQLALISLGLSRSAALAVADLLREDEGEGEGGLADDHPDEHVLTWFVGARLTGRDLPKLIEREAEGLRLSISAANDV